jgi:hypothetical protein
MGQELLILPEHPWFIVQFMNTTGNTNGAGTINPSGTYCLNVFYLVLDYLWLFDFF